MATAVDRRVRLRDQVVLFLIAGEIVDLIRDPAIRHLAIRRFDETKFVDPCEVRHRTDQVDVRAFRSFDRANPAVVRLIDDANYEPGEIATQSACYERGQTALVG